jgi:hypothetical protein
VRCGHAADASLAPTETPDIVLLLPLTPSAECLGASKRVYAAFGQLGACADAWVTSSTFERRRSRAMPILSMKTKKPMKPMLEMLAITDEAGLSSPNQPASAPTSRPSHPIHRGSARVVRMATAYSVTTTPKPRKLPAVLVTRAMAAKVSAVAASVACPPGSPGIRPHFIDQDVGLILVA